MKTDYVTVVQLLGLAYFGVQVTKDNSPSALIFVVSFIEVITIFFHFIGIYIDDAACSYRRTIRYCYGDSEF